MVKKQNEFGINHLTTTPSNFKNETNLSWQEIDEKLSKGTIKAWENTQGDTIQVKDRYKEKIVDPAERYEVIYEPDTEIIPSIRQMIYRQTNNTFIKEEDAFEYAEQTLMANNR